MVQFFPFLCCDLSVFAFSDPVQSQIHDPDPFQLLYLISQIPAHSADLPVQSLCQNDPKAAFSCLHHSAWSGHRIKNRDSLAHPSDKFPVHRLIHCHKIFFLMIVSGAHDLIDQISFVCQKEKAHVILYPVCPQDKHAEDNPDNLLPSSHQTAALCCTRSLWVC